MFKLLKYKRLLDKYDKMLKDNKEDLNALLTRVIDLLTVIQNDLKEL